jgi:gamma-glutamylcyclotransferase (GGCT)/AIG2-like uncharacterized protein YtfP
LFQHTRERNAPALDFTNTHNDRGHVAPRNMQSANTMLPLFVYGSLIDPVHRAEVLGHPAEGVPATLHGFERGRSRYWFIRRCEGVQIDGLVLANLDERDYATLDAYEEVPTLYTREQIDVVGPEGLVLRCWVYLPTAWADGTC